MNIHQKKLESLGKEFALNILTELNEVEAIAFEGAVARGFTDKYSDVDIVCLCSKIPSLQKRKKLLRPLVDKLNEDFNVPMRYLVNSDYIRYAGKSIGVSYERTKEFEHLINHFKSNRISESELAKIVTKAYYVKIIWDPQKIYSRLKTNVPKSDALKIVELFLYYLSGMTMKGKWPKLGFQVDLYRKNLMATDRRFQEAIDFYLKLLYALNGEYFFVPKWAHKSIKKLKIKPKRCWERIQTIFEQGNDAASVKKKVKIFEGLVRDLHMILVKRELK